MFELLTVRNFVNLVLFICLFYMDNIVYIFPWNTSYSININNLIKYVYN